MKVDGFDLKYTSRTSWKAARRQNGTLIDVVPVTWTKGWSTTDAGPLLEVWFQKSNEMEEHRNRREPFVVAVAVAKDYKVHPHQHKQFVGVYRVASTGRALSEDSIETRVIERVTARHS